MKKSDIVERLLEAAFKELQHDTGPSDPEYVSQRATLKREFTKALRPLRVADSASTGHSE